MNAPDPGCPRKPPICNFEPRYDTRPPAQLPDGMDVSTCVNDDDLALIKAMSERTYVLDVCVNCGRSVRR